MAFRGFRCLLSVASSTSRVLLLLSPLLPLLLLLNAGLPGRSPGGSGVHALAGLMAASVGDPSARGTATGGEALASARTLGVADETAENPVTTLVELPELHVTAVDRFYDVDGADPRSALASVRQRGPHDAEGDWAASTSWSFRWSYMPALDGGCSIGTANVDLRLTYTYPRWVTASATTPAAQAAWSTYLANVKTHELEHGEIAQASATELVHALEQVPAQPTCDDLASLVAATAHDQIERHAQAQAAYDQATQHGIAQGAVLTASQ